MCLVLILERISTMPIYPANWSRNCSAELQFARNIKLFHNCETHQLLCSILPFRVSIFITDVEVDHKKVIAKDVHQKLKMCI